MEKGSHDKCPKCDGKKWIYSRRCWKCYTRGKGRSPSIKFNREKRKVKRNNLTCKYCGGLKSSQGTQCRECFYKGRKEIREQTNLPFLFGYCKMCGKYKPLEKAIQKKIEAGIVCSNNTCRRHYNRQKLIEAWHKRESK